MSAIMPAVFYDLSRFSNEDPKQTNVLGGNICIRRMDSCSSVWSTRLRQLKQRHREPQSSAQAGSPPTVILPFSNTVINESLVSDTCKEQWQRQRMVRTAEEQSYFLFAPYFHSLILQSICYLLPAIQLNDIQQSFSAGRLLILNFCSVSQSLT